MASANMGLVRSIYAAWERGEFDSVEWAHPEIEFVRPDGPSPGSSTGLHGIAQHWGDFLSVWEGFRVEAEEYVELDAERVLVLAAFSGRGKTSDVELGLMSAKGASLFRVSDGKVTGLALYSDRDRGLAELGLAPE